MKTKHTPGPWIAKNNQIWNEDEAMFIVAKNFNIISPSQTLEANARLGASAPEMYELIELFGETVTNMFEQLEKGNWKDDHGHDVKLNSEMMALIKPVKDAIKLRAKIEWTTK